MESEPIGIVCTHLAARRVAGVLIATGAALLVLAVLWSRTLGASDAPILLPLLVLGTGVLLLFDGPGHRATGLFGTAADVQVGRCLLELDGTYGGAVRQVRALAATRLGPRRGELLVDVAVERACSAGAASAPAYFCTAVFVGEVRDGRVARTLASIRKETTSSIFLISDRRCYGMAGGTADHVREWMTTVERIVRRAFPEAEPRRRLLLRPELGDRLTGTGPYAALGGLARPVFDVPRRKAAVRETVNGQLHAIADQLGWEVDVVAPWRGPASVARAGGAPVRAFPRVETAGQ